MASRTSPGQSTLGAAEQLAVLLDSAREMHAILSADGAILFASAGFSRILGYRPERLTGRPLTSLLHAADTGAVCEHLADLSTHRGAAFVDRCCLAAKDGSGRWFEVTARNRLHEPAAKAITVSFLDVSELRRMEAERQVIADVVRALNETANLDELLRQIHRAISKVVNAENCFVALHDPASGTFHFPFFVDQFDSAPPPQEVGRSCTAFVFRTGCAILIPQSEFDRLVERGDVELVGSPSPAWLGVPLKTPTATIGVLVVQHYQNESAYDARDLEFLESVGGHIALAIDRRRAEEALRKSESMFRLLFANSPLPTWVADEETLKVLKVNEAAIRQYGYDEAEFTARTMLDIRPQADRQSYEAAWCERNHQEWHLRTRHQKKDGSAFDADVISHPMEYGGRPVRLVVAQDVSERQQLEQQLRQAQKMEAVGRLAGGVAHDFNNLLMVIKGHTELLLGAIPASDPMARKIEQIDRSADRATSLTRQLLAFSRMQVLQPRAISVNSIVADMSRLLPRLIGEDIELVVRLDPAVGTIRADASQIEQIVMNLAVNARDAMAHGGRLVIETSNAELDEAYHGSHPVVRPGRYVLLAVTDTGTGMDAETQAHIFEPFFTTKEKGKGTGLGLSTVYGVVKQSGGFIWVYSEPGKGTSFKIYLPRVDQPVDSPVAPVVVSAPSGTETVLLAEDEQDVRELAREFLESGGYKVIEAKDGGEALRLAKEQASGIDLLVTDMVMPGMGGQELARRLQAERQNIGVVYMSGYSEHAAAEAAREDSAALLLTKPFSRSAILRAVREALSRMRA
jgi:PAS domain S-box-containing protein